MALRWFLNSAICHVLGYPTSKNPNNYLHEKHGCSGVNIGRSSNTSNGGGLKAETHVSSTTSSGFQMPLHYPRYTKADYQKMEEWKVDMLLREYGLSFEGNLDEKREYAMGAFLWPEQY